MAKDQRQSSTRAARLKLAPYKRTEMEVSGFGDEPYFPVVEEDIRNLRLDQNQPRRLGREGNLPVRARPNAFPVFIATVVFFAFFWRYLVYNFPEMRHGDL
ncbi:hypothetical protein Moror_2143 [Moniliophthora roreri MCA 2997]|uniref:Uncharacterized protein n=2 Tax=Moniliophthora roreri TaxID=221103 RepID=V2XWC4_MONRO|nr:hypothetical protein Moror_2143 [Moniliophthora roreri MCA 2997]KAI3598072.1 hypothetical protein WG66_009099 [Moniliophthora roreri]